MSGRLTLSPSTVELQALYRAAKSADGQGAENDDLILTVPAEAGTSASRT